MAKARGQERAELLWRAELDFSGTHYPAIVLNISRTGMKVACQEVQAKMKQQKAQIRCVYVPGLPPLSLAAELVWVGDGMAGLHFSETLSAKDQKLIESFLSFHLG
jgi:hypothetical protein